ncbi:MAG: TraR/DksA family transcriptional regulator [Candidatus Zixiibacteriota bacterium]|nr:MAG: TraR/DksA family transcriptional regulator [candidate division Zixibacteria bacterium]HHI02388.1 TraR/DksA family transcriptional regulator [candidate division Zixibacteria bacterium]
MKKSELKKYEKLLLKKREEMVALLNERKTQIDSTIKEATGDLSGYSYHMADQGTDAMEREKAFMFASKSGRLLYHIDEALRRLRKGEYGNCHSCGKPIAKARLEAVPHARFCIECKEQEENAKKSRR